VPLKRPYGISNGKYNTFSIACQLGLGLRQKSDNKIQHFTINNKGARLGDGSEMRRRWLGDDGRMMRAWGLE